MKVNDDSKVVTNEYDNNAQAVNESELLPIYNAMDFSGDIQPLEDIAVPEKVVTDYEIVKDEVKTSDKKQIFNKKILSHFKGIKINENKKAIRIGSLVLAVSILAVCMFFVVKKQNQNDSYITDIYTDATGETFFKLSDGDNNSINDISKIRTSSNGKILCYSKNASANGGKADLYCIDISKKSSIRKHGKYINKNVFSDWVMTEDGKYICYSKDDGGKTKHYFYSVKENHSQEIGDSIENIYLPPSGDTVYYTRKGESSFSLLKLTYSTESVIISTDVTNVRMYALKNEYEIIFTKAKKDSDTFDLYTLGNEKEAVCICNDVSEAYLDDYSYYGNLYYFVRNTSGVNWQEYVDDNYAISDRKLTVPNKEDYMVEFGFIFKRNVLDVAAYNSAMAKYNAKLTRDKLRRELDSLNLVNNAKDTFNCYAYSNSVSVKLITGVQLDNVIAFAKNDAPRVISKKAALNVENKISMDKLVSFVNSDGVEKAIDYVRAIVSDSYNVVNGCFYSWNNGQATVEIEIDDYNLKQTQFIMGDRNTVYAIDGNELYYNTVSNGQLGKKILIDSNASACTVSGKNLYYNKVEQNGMQSLYQFTREGGKSKVAENTVAYKELSDGTLAVMSKTDENSRFLSFGIFSSSAYREIDTKIHINSFRFGEDTVKYIKDGEFEREEYNFSLKKGTAKVAQNVSNIIY